MMKKNAAALLCKKIGAAILLAVLLIAAMQMAAAEASFSYSNNGDGTCTITGATNLPESLVVPETVDGLRVTAIGDSAFYNCYGLKEVVIPEGITEIGDSAFTSCSNLESVTLPDSLVHLGDMAFQYCGKLTSISLPDSLVHLGDMAFFDCSKLTSISLPENIEYIGYYAFYDTGITEIMLPPYLTYVDYGLLSIENIRCHEGSATHRAIERYIEEQRRWDPGFSCSYTTIPPFAVADHGDGTCTLEHYYGSQSVLELPQTIDGLSVTAIGAHAFRKTPVSFLFLSGNIVSIDDEAFSGCEQLLVYARQNSYAHTWCAGHGVNACVYTVAGGASTIVDCLGTKADVVLPDEMEGYPVTAIGEYAFDRRPMESITLPGQLETIGSGAFSYCDRLTAIELPASVSYVAADAFAPYCGLRKISVAPENESYTVYRSALFTKDMKTLVHFPAALSVTRFVAPSGTEQIGAYAFMQDHWLEEVKLPNSVQSIGENAFYDCISLTAINLPSSIGSIADSAFVGCGNLTAYVDDGSYAHTWCVENGINVQVTGADVVAEEFAYANNGDGTCTITTYLGRGTQVTVPDSIDGLVVTGISQYAFDRCNMQSITLPDTLRSIASYAFSYCENLTALHIPAGVTDIAPDAFYPYCGVARFTVSADNTVYATINGVLMSKDLSTLVRYPATRADWKFSVPVGTKHIGPLAFAQNPNLETVILPAGLETIGTEAFSCCISLSEINLPESICQIGNAAFISTGNLVAQVVENSYAHNWCLEHCVDVQVSGGDVVSNEFAYLDNGDGTCTITGYLGLDDQVVIPGEINGFVVTHIAAMAFDRCIFSSVTLPDSLLGIGDWAFNYCQNLTEIHLPANVKDVTAAAFQYYSGISRITVAPDNSTYTIRNDALLKKEGSVLVYHPAGLGATSYTVPDGVITIGRNAFSENRDLEQIVLPESVNRIETGAFSWCTGLNAINLPASIKYIDISAFTDCGNVVATVWHGTYAHLWCARNGIDMIVLKRSVSQDGDFAYLDNGDGTCTITDYLGDAEAVVVPDTINGLTVIGLGSFVFDRSEMQSITLPAQLQFIESGAFSYCENLTSLHIPAGVERIAEDAFIPYCGVQSFTVSGDNTAYAGLNGVLMSKDLSTLVRYPAGHGGWKYTVPACTRHIQTLAFAQCYGLEKVVLPAGIQTIGTEAFAGSIFLREINLPGSIVQIGDRAFADCGNLTAEVTENSYAHIWCVDNNIDVQIAGADVFTDEFIYVNNGDGTCSITGCLSFSMQVTVPDSIDGLTVTHIDSYAFDRCGMKSVILPDTLRSIASYAFSYCENLTALHIPAGVTDIAPDAFSPYCGVENFTVSEENTVYATIGGVLMSKDLSTLVRYPAARAGWKYAVPAGTKHIGPMAFAQSVNLDLITLPAGVKTIGAEAFSCCIGLCEINLPGSIEQIGEGAFTECGNFLAKVVQDSYAHVWCVENGIDVMATATDVVAGEFAYRSYSDGTCAITDYLGVDAHVIIPNEIDGFVVTAINEMAFDRQGFSAITLPDSLQRIGNWAFNYCENLTAIHLPASVYAVTAEAFQCYSGIGEITVDEESPYFSAVDNVLMNKEQTTFVYRPASSGATEYTVPDGITTIARYAFGENRNLERITLPEGLIRINTGAFIWCYGLNEINLPASIRYIDDAAFAECGNFVATVRDGSYAHRWCLSHGIDVKVLNLSMSEDGRFVINDNGDGTCTITDYLASEDHVAVPEVINGLTVTGLDKYAFDRCGMQSITLPDTLQMINSNAFSYCESLTALHIPAGVTDIAPDAFSPYCGVENFTVSEENTVYATINGVLMSRDLSTLVRYPAARNDWRFSVPAGTKHIGPMAFTQSTGLDLINLPAGVETIGEEAFAGCVSLCEINLPGSVRQIGDRAFADCGGFLAKVVRDSYAHVWCVENSIDVLATATDVVAGEFAYRSNGDGTSTITGYLGLSDHVVIPGELDGLVVTAINEMAFDRQGFSAITLPDSLQSIGNWAFNYCENLTAIHLPAGVYGVTAEAFQCYSGIGEITVDGQNPYFSAVDNVLMNREQTTLVYRPAASGATEYTVPAGVTTIARYAFGENRNLERITLPEGLSRIEAGAFIWCYGLSEINLPASVSYIDESAFAECGNFVARVEAGSYAHEWCVVNNVETVFAQPTVAAMSLNRIIFDAEPYGMSLENSSTNGSVSILIDDENTDWDQVLTFNETVPSNDPEDDSERIMYGFSIVAPENAVYVKHMTGIWDSDGQMIDELSALAYNPIDDATLSWKSDIAAYDKQTGEFIPFGTKAGDDLCYVCSWADADGNTLLVEMLGISYQHTDVTGQFPAGYVTLANSSIIPDTAQDVLATVSDGMVTYYLPEEGVSSICTDFRAPEGAVWYSISDRYSSSNWRNELNGQTTGAYDSLYAQRYFICWYDADDQLMGGGYVFFEFKSLADISFLLPDAMTTLEEEAFEGIVAIYVVIPEGCTSIGERSFANCLNLIRVDIPSSLRSIADNAFEGSENVTLFIASGNEEAVDFAIRNGLNYTIK